MRTTRLDTHLGSVRLRRELAAHRVEERGANAQEHALPLLLFSYRQLREALLELGGGDQQVSAVADLPFFDVSPSLSLPGQ